MKSPQIIRNLAILVATLLIAAAPAGAAEVLPATPDDTATMIRATGMNPATSTVDVATAESTDQPWHRATDHASRRVVVGYIYPDGLDDQGVQMPDVLEVTLDQSMDTRPRECWRHGIPKDIGRAFGVCRPADRSTVLMTHRGERVKPSTVAWGAHAGVVRVKWSGWNRGRARGRGMLDYVDRTTRFRVPVELTASRRVYCGVDPFGRPAYTRVQLRFVRAADRQRYRALQFTARPGCP